MTIVQLNLFTTASLCTYQWKSRGEGGGMRARGGFDAWDYPPDGLFIVQSDPAVKPRGRDIWLWFDRPKPGIWSSLSLESPSRISESHASVGERYEVFICFNRHNPILLTVIYCKQILSILRKLLSSSCHLIVKLRLKSNSTIKVRGLFTGHWSDLFRHVEQIFIKQ